MTYLDAAVLVVGAVAALNLLLTVALIRRLRAYGTELSRMTTPFGDAPASILPAGESPAEFSAPTLDGDTVSRDDLVESTLIAFLAPNCEACRDELPVFVERAAQNPGGRGNVLAVVVDSAAGGHSRYVDQLQPVARVVVEPYDGPVTTAFAVRSLPAFVEMDERGQVRRVAHRASRLPILHADPVRS